MPLPRTFFQHPTLKVAQDLLGCFLYRQTGKTLYRAQIIETEAYIGEDDLACHASKGRTPRTEIMYGEAGRAYIYLIYGMYYLMNIVTEKKEFPAAVLLRGLNNLEKWDNKKKEWILIRGVKLDGPGKLTKALQIDIKLRGHDITKGEKLWVEKGEKKLSSKSIVLSKRVGIDYAKHCQEYLWRFNIKHK